MTTAAAAGCGGPGRQVGESRMLARSVPYVLNFMVEYFVSMARVVLGRPSDRLRIDTDGETAADGRERLAHRLDRPHPRRHREGDHRLALRAGPDRLQGPARRYQAERYDRDEQGQDRLHPGRQPPRHDP